MNKFWTTKEGNRIAYKDLSNDHLLNIINHVKKQISLARDMIDNPPLSDDEHIDIDGYGGLEDRMDRMSDKLLGLLKEAKSRGLEIN